MERSGPVLDVMVPMHNHVELSIQCLQVLYAHTRTPFHLIVCDDSTDLTPLWMNQFCKEHDNVTYVYSKAPYKCGNQFFNHALPHAKTPYIAFVMNSVRVDPGWELGPLQVFQAEPKAGIVGLKCLLPNGLIESAGLKMIKWLPCDIGRGDPAQWHSLTHEMEAVQWAFAVGRVEALKGNLPEDVFHGFVGWDDIDNNFLLRKAGWKVFYCGAGSGTHYVRATRGNDSAEAARKNAENGQRFYKRWGFWDEFVKQNGEDGQIHTPPKMMQQVLA